MTNPFDETTAQPVNDPTPNGQQPRDPVPPGRVPGAFPPPRVATTVPPTVAPPTNLPPAAPTPAAPTAPAASVTPGAPTAPPTSFPINIPSVPPPPSAPTTTQRRPAEAGPPAASGYSNDNLAPLGLPQRDGMLRGDTVRIGIWGSGRSGKSTFLAALPLAAMSSGSWIVNGTSAVAAEFLNHAVNRLVNERQFPRPNMVADHISWSFRQNPPPQRGVMSWFRSARQAEFVLELHDPPGAHYEAGHVDPTVIELLSNAEGLLYLLDPLAAADDQSFQHFFEALQLLTARMSANGQLRGGRLPHFVAVCVTKFDDETFFRRLVSETDLVTQDTDGMRLPRVRHDRSREFFNFVCDRVLGARAGMVRNGLQAYFHPDRVQFFASSAIGFRLNARQQFDFRDFNNVALVGGVAATLRDVPRPINVLEPLVFLEHRISEERHR